MAQFSELSEDVILHIFSFIPFRLLRRTICRVCKMWHRIASDPAIVRKASSHEFESIRLCDTINDRQLKNLVKRIVWARTEDIIVFDLAKTSISWEYVDDASRRSHWRKLRVLNIAKLVTSEFQVSTTLANLLELNVCKSEFSDNHLLEVSRMCKTLRILNVSGCRITDLGVENVSLESLVFFNIANSTAHFCQNGQYAELSKAGKQHLFVSKVLISPSSNFRNCMGTIWKPEWYFFVACYLIKFENAFTAERVSFLLGRTQHKRSPFQDSKFDLRCLDPILFCNAYPKSSR